MFMTIQSNVKDKILATSSKMSKVENAPAEMLRDLDQQMEKRADDEIGESSLTRPELVLDTTDKVVLIKEKLKAARDHQKSYADKRRKPLEFEVGDRLLLKVSPWKGVCLADANLHVPLIEIKIDKTLCFVEELVEIMDREIRNLKHSKIPLVKVHWNSKRGPEFIWKGEDHMKSKYPQLFDDRAVESAS
ncbi:hypothetical protein Tco_0686915 [Tanacetum coccineum]